MKRFAILLLGVVVACGPMTESQPIVGAARSLFGASADPGAVALDPRRDLSRDIIESSPTDFILLAIVSRDAAATAQFVGANGSRQTWATLDGISLTFDNGLVVATRGLGDDLMGSDPSEVYHALRHGGGEVLRINDYLGSQDDIVRASYYCDIQALGSETIEIFERSYATQKFQEICVSPDQQFENLYWIDSSGTIWQSRQWLSALVGYLEVQRL